MRRTRVSQTLGLPLAPRPTGETKQAWIYRCIRDAILSGALQRGDRLPASRDLAANWGISRGIVELAFEQLVLEGYAESRIGWGTVVTVELGVASPVNNQRHRLGSLAEHRPAAQAPVEAAPKSARLVDTSLFAVQVWRRHLNRAMKALTPALLAENDPKGYGPLRESIARYLRITRGIQCETSQIVVTTGIRHAIDLVSRTLIGNETAYYVEDPGYKGLTPLLRAVEDRIVYIPTDEEGFSVSDAEPYGRPGVVYVTPAHQAPLGVTMSIDRRSQLLSWAAARDIWIVEDDYDSEFSYGLSPLPALKAIDREDRVIHCGSFNKSLFPSLRIGYMVVPDAIRGRVIEVRSAAGRSNSIVEQVALASYINDGDFARHLRSSRDEYMRRRDRLLAELRHALGEKLRISGEHAGFHFILWLPAESDEGHLVDCLRRDGVYVEGLNEFARGRRCPPALVVGYASLRYDRISDTARCIANALLVSWA